MSTLHVDVGNLVNIWGDPRTHRVSWANYHAFDTACGLIVEDYQPDYYERLLAVDELAMIRRVDALYSHPDHPGHAPNNDSNGATMHPALRLQRAPDDAPITCLLCLSKAWYVEEDAQGPSWAV